MINEGFGSPSGLIGFDSTPSGFGDPLARITVKTMAPEVETAGGEVVIESDTPWPDGPLEVRIMPVNVKSPYARKDRVFPGRLTVYCPALPPGRYGLAVYSHQGVYGFAGILYVLPERGHPRVRMLNRHFPPQVYRTTP